MKEISILVGGKAGDGIRQAGILVAKLLNELGYWIFLYDDYPSLISGGHNFSIIRASQEKILAHNDKVDFIIAFNEDTIKNHQTRITKNTVIFYDSEVVKSKTKGYGIPVTKIVKDNALPMIVRNTVNLGIFAGALNIDFKIVEKVIRESLGKKVEENIKVAKIGYDQAKKLKLKFKISKVNNKPKKLLTGNDTTALGAVKGGMKLFIAYPMTPASNILHYLAAHEKELNIKTSQVENEIAVALMIEGAAYAGVRTMTGTSGGGFALMVEAVSLAGQAEIPVVFALSQRPGPATGVPTYTTQGDLFFAMYSGHGEFLRILLAPGDADEAFYLAAESMNLAWEYQTPVILLLDKHLSESTYSVNYDEKKVKIEKEKLWSGKGDYKRYAITKDGISPLAYPGNKNALVKATSYEHDEFGISTEDSKQITQMIDKRLRKKNTLIAEMRKKETVKVYGKKTSKIVLITWGSTKGAVVEVGEKLGLKVIQPLYLEPLPDWQIKKELAGAKMVVDIEVNATAQFATLLKQHGINVDKKVLKYDGRPFAADELEAKIKKIIKK